jgi:iron complex outermembrane receptor protein
MRNRCAEGMSVVLIVLLPSVAWAQANANATANASDAFGFRTGDDTVGIYDEAAVRGFSLESAGNYRLEGTYFVKNSGVSYFFLESSVVRIGYNTLNTIIPGPSGVVDYHLRDPKRGEPSFVTMTAAQYGEIATDVLFKHRTAGDRVSLALGLARVFEGRDQQGGRAGRSLLPAGTARITTGWGTVRMFGGEYQYDRPGQFRVVAQGAALPPHINRGRFLGQRWAMEQGERRIAGALFDTPGRTGRGAGGTFVFSQEDPTRGFTQLFSDVQSDGTARSVVVAIPQQRSTAWSGELRGHIEKTHPRFSHRVDVTLRGRVSRARSGGTQVIDLGRVPFGVEASAAPEPSLDRTVAARRDQVDQIGLGATYRTAWNSRLRANVGLLKTRYEKRVASADDTTRDSVADPWLYNSALALRLRKGLEVYGTYSTGLEESGVAPATAANRNEVLPPIAVTQREFGVRVAPSPGITLVAAGFDTRKPYSGVDAATGRYGLLGAVRHRGVEASVAGRPMTGLSLVIGSVWLAPRLSGIEVDPGRIGKRPVGVPTFRAIANIDYSIPPVKGLTVDAAATSIGRRAARSAPLADGTQLEVERLVTVNVGTRYVFRLFGTSFALRAQLQNLFDQFSWEVNSSETLNYSAPRRARLVLTANF